MQNLFKIRKEKRKFCFYYSHVKVSLFVVNVRFLFPQDYFLIVYTCVLLACVFMLHSCHIVITVISKGQHLMFTPLDSDTELSHYKCLNIAPNESEVVQVVALRKLHVHKL